MFTYNQVIKRLRLLQENHLQLNSFGTGELHELMANKTLAHPAMWVMPNPSTVSGKMLNLSFSILVMDIVKKDESNEQDVLSDTLSILLDIFAQLQSPTYQDDFTINPDISIEQFTERFDDEVSGWVADIVFSIPQLNNRCDVPSNLTL